AARRNDASFAWVPPYVIPGPRLRSHGRGPQQRDDLVPEQLMGLRHFVEESGPMQDRKKMARPDGTALLDDLLRHLAWRAGNELLVADGEAATGPRLVRDILFHPGILRHEALQALGDRITIAARLALRHGHRDPTTQRQALGPCSQS